MSVHLVQVVTASLGASSTTLTATITPSAGSVLHAVANGNDCTSIAFSDNVNGSWGAVLDTFTDVFEGSSNAIWAQGRKENVAGSATTVTATYGSATNVGTLKVYEIAGNSNPALDGHAGQVLTVFDGTPANSITAGSVTSAHGPALILGFLGGLDFSDKGGGGNITVTPGTGFTVFDTPNVNDPYAFRCESKRVTAAGSNAGTWQASGTGANASNYDVFVAVYDEASAGGASVGGVEYKPPEARRSARPTPFTSELPPPLVRRAAGISVTEPLRRRDVRPLPFGGEPIEPSANPSARIDTSPPLWRAAPRPAPAGGDGGAVHFVAGAIVPLADVSAAARRTAPRPTPMPMPTEAVPPLVATTGPPLTGLKLWLKGDAGVTLSGPNVTTWADQSGNSNNYVQATGGQQPTVTSAALNGRPAITFDGSSQFLTSPFQIGGAKTVVIVRKLASVPGASTICEAYTLKDASNNFSEAMFFNFSGYQPYSLCHNLNGLTSPTVGDAAALDTSWHVGIDTYNGGANTSTSSYTLTLDSVSQTLLASAAFNRISTDLVTLGARATSANVGSSFAPVQIAEVLIYDHVLSGTDMTAVESYLNVRYFPGAPSGVATETTPPVWRSPARQAVFGGDPLAAPVAPPLASFAVVSDPQWRRFPPPQPASGDVSPPVARAPVFAETSPPTWRSSPRPAPGGSEAVPPFVRLVVTVVEAALSVATRISRAIGWASNPFPSPSPQTVVIATVPAAATQAIGLTSTTVTTTMGPTRSY